VEDLIFRSLRGETSDLEERQLRRWREASFENETFFQEIAFLDRLPVDRVGDPVGSDSRPPSPAAIRARAEARRAGARKKAAIRRWWPRVATVLAAASIIGFFRLALPGVSHTLSATQFVTSHKETVTATLSDGSLVRLGPDSWLRFANAGSSREARLHGQGFFAVAKDPGHPFVIETDAGVVRVVGTRFDVQAREGKLRLAVVEGSVALKAAGVEVRLGPGEVSHVEQGLPPAVVRVKDVYALLDGPSGFLVFQSTPLSQVVAELERGYRMRIEIADSALGRRTVTAWFSDQSATEALTTVCRVVRARCTIGKSVATIAPASP
jgi:transmembrane sensor